MRYPGNRLRTRLDGMLKQTRFEEALCELMPDAEMCDGIARERAIPSQCESREVDEPEFSHRRFGNPDLEEAQRQG